MTSDRKKKLIATLAAAIAGIGVLISGAYDTPDDMFTNNEVSDKNHIVIEASTSVKEKEKAPLISRIPFLVKAIFAVPLWLLGTIVIELIDKFLKITFLPLLKYIILWILLFLIIMGIIVLIIKLLFPEMKIRDIITRKMIMTVAAGTLVMLLITILLPMAYKPYENYKYVGLFAMGLVLIVYELYPYVKMKAQEPVIIYDEF